MTPVHDAGAPRMKSWEGSTVVITGVGRPGQVGEAVAQAFAAEGAAVALVGRRESEVRERAASITAAGGRAAAYGCDLADVPQVSALARRVADGVQGREGRAGGLIDALVHLAGGFAMSGPLGKGEADVFQQMVEINLTTAWVVSNAFVPMVRDGGSVVYVAAASALPGAKSAKMSAYVAAKAGVIGLMYSVADESRPRGVRANAVAPTAIRTADNLRSMGADARYVDRAAVANTILFLCSPDSAITGQVFRLAD